MDVTQIALLIKISLFEFSYQIYKKKFLTHIFKSTVRYKIVFVLFTGHVRVRLVFQNFVKRTNRFC